MNKFKYQISDKPYQEILGYEACKKGNNQHILTCKWKLVDRCSDKKILCFLCEENRDDTAPRSFTEKMERRIASLEKRLANEKDRGQKSA